MAKEKNTDKAPSPPVTSEDEDPDTPAEPTLTAHDPPQPHGLKRIWNAYLTKKKLTIPATFIVLLLLVLILPWTRYSVLGLFMKTDFTVTVLDAQTNKPVSEATLELAGKMAKTDGEGKAVVSQVRLGRAPLEITKKYYQNYHESVVVSWQKTQNHREVKLHATGRPVVLTVNNKITGKGLAGVTIAALDTEAKTDETGEATVVVPADKATAAVRLKLEGYNELASEIVVDQSGNKNTFSLSPAGKLYFLSKKSGKIDVVKTDLDGANRQTVLAGTGREEDASTVLLASRDWKYLALHARREGKKPKLYLIDTTTDKVSVMDEGDATFDIIGWHNEYFMFYVNRSKQAWEDKGAALKHFNAKTGQLKTLDETAAEGTQMYDYASESYGSAYILDNILVYTKQWNWSYSYSVPPYNVFNRLQGKQNGIYAIKPDGSGKKTIKALPLTTATRYAYLYARLYEPEEIYFYHGQEFTNAPGTSAYFEYEDGVIKDAPASTKETFNKSYPTFLVSPSGRQTFWSESRDGKNTLFLGDKKGANEQEIGSLSELTPYGWFGEEYLLASKKGSELFIMPKEKNATPFKVADYHKPEFDASGYGYGYGGF